MIEEGKKAIKAIYERNYKPIPRTVELYWCCKNCGKYHLWPENKAKVYCDRKCLNAAFYKKRK